MITPFNLFLLGLLIGIYPLLSALIACIIGSIIGINVNEGFVRDYYIGNWNLGYTLHNMFVIGWLCILTIPAGLVIIFSAGLWALFT